MRIAKSIRLLEPYTPGEQPKGKGVIKLNTNENPYPPSPKCREALQNLDIEKLRKYPDPVFIKLRKAIAKLNNCRVENVFVGNGSDEILALAAKAFVEDDGSIASLDPSYSLYKTIAAIRNVAWRGYPPDELENSKCGARKANLFFWTNPNAPTGELATCDKIAAFAKSFNGVLLVDEAYADFARENAMKLATRPGNDNIIVMRTFSKSYSLAGLRVGYAVGPKDLIDALYKIKDSYNIDAIAQALALAAIRDQKWMKANATKIKRTRERLTKELSSRGWDIPQSESNFVFARPPKGNAEEIFLSLKEKNIFTRYFKGRKTGDRIRITIGTDEQIDKLLKVLKQCIH